MNLSSDIKPISYLKSKTAEVINEANENTKTIV
jgi:hypothetical protein